MAGGRSNPFCNEDANVADRDRAPVLMDEGALLCTDTSAARAYLSP
jgi:hypothetical protein